jgi:hypothetical protein
MSQVCKKSKSYSQSLGKEQCFLLIGVCRQTITYFQKAACALNINIIIIILIMQRIIFTTFKSPIRWVLFQTIYKKCLYINIIILKTIRAHTTETTKYAFGVLNVSWDNTIFESGRLSLNHLALFFLFFFFNLFYITEIYCSYSNL